jgi:hypothetical protein
VVSHEKKAMKKIKKAGIVIVAAVLAILAAASLYVRSIATRALPDYNETVALRGLIEEVIVYRDSYAVPHIFAKNEGDLFRAIGFCMAQDRLWQMDVMRRACAGRLAEVFGKELVDADLLMRSLRIPDKSRLMLSKCEPELIDSLDAFFVQPRQELGGVQGGGKHVRVHEPEHRICGRGGEYRHLLLRRCADSQGGRRHLDIPGMDRRIRLGRAGVV